MTPLTHAAAGIVIYQKLRSRFPRYGWALALPLAFASHYLLDAIPHFEDVGSMKSPGRVPIFLGLGLIGAVFALFLRRWNREAALIWLLLSLWIGVGSYSYPLLRVLTAVLGLVYFAWKSKQRAAVGYLAGGMLATVADLIPLSISRMEKFHDAIHYQTGWGQRLYLFFSESPVSLRWRERMQNPYFLAGYGLELLVEGVIFFGALYLLSRERFSWRTAEADAHKVREPAELMEKN